MANQNIRVTGHFADASGKTLTHFGTALQFNLSVSMLTSPGDGAARPDPASIKTILSNNSKIPGGASQFIVTGYSLMDHDNGSGILS